MWISDHKFFELTKALADVILLAKRIPLQFEVRCSLVYYA
jgi:hypothetical protein